MRQHVDEAGGDGSALHVDFGSRMPVDVWTNGRYSIAVDRHLADVGRQTGPIVDESIAKDDVVQRIGSEGRRCEQARTCQQSDRDRVSLRQTSQNSALNSTPKVLGRDLTPLPMRLYGLVKPLSLSRLRAKKRIVRLSLQYRLVLKSRRSMVSDRL